MSAWLTAEWNIDFWGDVVLGEDIIFYARPKIYFESKSKK